MDSEEKAFWTFPIIAGVFDIATTYIGLQHPALYETNPLINGLEIYQMMPVLFAIKSLCFFFALFCYIYVLEGDNAWSYDLFLPLSISFIWFVAGFINLFQIIQLNM